MKLVQYKIGKISVKKKFPVALEYVGINDFRESSTEKYVKSNLEKQGLVFKVATGISGERTDMRRIVAALSKSIKNAKKLIKGSAILI